MFNSLSVISKNSFHGNFCFYCRFSEISNINTDFFLEEMIHNSSHVCSQDPSDAQCRAWNNSKKVLSKTYKSLPPSYADIWLVFEYVLPNHKPGTKKFSLEQGIRPDVLVIGNNFVSVLEFKQRHLDSGNILYKGYISQAQKYVTGLNKYHLKSRNSYIAPIIVLTLEKNYLVDNTDYIACSGDKLSDALLLLNGDNPASLSHSEIVEWLSDDK